MRSGTPSIYFIPAPPTHRLTGAQWILPDLVINCELEYTESSKLVCIEKATYKHNPRYFYLFSLSLLSALSPFVMPWLFWPLLFFRPLNLYFKLWYVPIPYFQPPFRQQEFYCLANPSTLQCSKLHTSTPYPNFPVSPFMYPTSSQTGLLPCYFWDLP